MENEEKLREVVENHPYPLLFVTISGAHLYGFPSEDSDYDLRGAHIIRCRETLGLDTPAKTFEQSGIRNGLDIDLVTHDIKKYFRLLLKNNGYVLEQIYSPLVIHTAPEHDELKEIARQCITKNMSLHYLGFAQNQWKFVEKAQRKRLKRLLYVFRVVLTGIHLMQTGTVEANLNVLNDKFHLPFITDMVEQKVRGSENESVSDANLEFYRSQYERLAILLQEEGERSPLPEKETAKEALDDLLVRVRLSTLRE
jgi:predicted nucleotidyltransferase